MKNLLLKVVDSWAGVAKIAHKLTKDSPMFAKISSYGYINLIRLESTRSILTLVKPQVRDCAFSRYMLMIVWNFLLNLY